MADHQIQPTWRGNMLRELGKRYFGVVLTTLVALFLTTEVVQTIVPSLQAAAVAQEEDGVGAEPAPAGPAPADGAAAKKKEQSMLMWTFEALGWRYTISFLAISFAFVALVIMNMLSVR